MKPQCNTSADCLRELARVMDQFGFSSTNTAIESKYVKSSGIDKYTEYFTTPTSWQFAISEVEGKPVFIGDELYCNDIKIIAAKEDTGFKLNHLSWNPPKPATVIVEMEVKDAMFIADSYAPIDDVKSHLERASIACAIALEKLT